MTEIFPSSSMLTAAKSKQSKYPWAALEVGQSFAVSKDGIKMTTLMALAARYGKRHGKRYRVVAHEDVYEVGRLPIAITANKQQPLDSHPPSPAHAPTPAPDMLPSFWESTKPK